MNSETNDTPFSEETAAQIRPDKLTGEERLELRNFKHAPVANLEITITLNGVVIDRKGQTLTRADICQSLCGRIESALTCFAHEVVKYPSRRLWKVLTSLTSTSERV